MMKMKSEGFLLLGRGGAGITTQKDEESWSAAAPSSEHLMPAGRVAHKGAPPGA